MNAFEPYNEAVRACFAHPVHAGDLQGEYAHALVASASSSDRGARVDLSIGVSEGTIVEMRYRALACPHLIAAAETLCANRENEPLSALQHFDTNELMQLLSIPVEKTGELLLLEDAVNLLWEQHIGVA
jgi:NifU-like protein involved in Fe-S cluster formation